MTNKHYRKRGDGSTTITLTISAEDKAEAKKMAQERGMSVSDLLHQWIGIEKTKDEHRKRRGVKIDDANNEE